MDIFKITYAFIDDKVVSKQYLLLGNCLRAGTERVRKADGRMYCVGLENNVGRPRSFLDAKHRANVLIRKFPEHKVTFRGVDGDGNTLAQVRFVTLSKAPPVATTPGVAGIDNIVGWIENEVSEGKLTSRRYAGICVCKTTTSGGHSDHADCAAIDVFDTKADMELMRDVILDWDEYFDTKYVILYQTIWFPGGESRPYSGDYHAHIHVSVTGGIYNSACA